MPIEDLVRTYVQQQRRRRRERRRGGGGAAAGGREGGEVRGNRSSSSVSSSSDLQDDEDDGDDVSSASAVADVPGDEGQEDVLGEPSGEGRRRSRPLRRRRATGFATAATAPASTAAGFSWFPDADDGSGVGGRRGHSREALPQRGLGGDNDGGGVVEGVTAAAAAARNGGGESWVREMPRRGSVASMPLFISSSSSDRDQEPDGDEDGDDEFQFQEEADDETTLDAEVGGVEGGDGLGSNPRVGSFFRPLLSIYA